MQFSKIAMLPDLIAALAGAVCVFCTLLISAGAALGGEAQQDHANHAHHGHVHMKNPDQLMDEFMQEADGRTCEIPEADLVSVDGQPVKLYADYVKSRTVVISPIYTECTTVCPPISANIAQVQDDLGSRVGKDIQLISISIDPVTDVPTRLKEWSHYFEPQEGWVFLTGEKDKVDRLLKGLKVFTPNLEDHPPVIIVANDQTGDCLYANGLAAPDQIEDIVIELANRSANAEEISK